jgi:hypothetical protein
MSVRCVTPSTFGWLLTLHVLVLDCAACGRATAAASAMSDPTTSRSSSLRQVVISSPFDEVV